MIGRYQEPGRLPSCPLCDSQEILPTRQINVEELWARWDQDFGIDIRSYFESIRPILLLECNRCHLQYFYPSSVSGSGDLYSQLQKFGWYYMDDKWEYNVALEDMGKDGKVLEVGCGSGTFIKKVLNETNLDPEGIELNAIAAEEAQRNGLSVRVLGLQEAAAAFPTYFDAVCSFQVLEHVADPKGFLELLCLLVKSGGKLILGLPNADSFLKYQFDPLDMPPHHMTRWPKETLWYLPRIFPLRLERMEMEPLAEYHVNGYVDAYCSVLGSYGIKKLLRPRIKSGFSKLLKQKGLRKFLTGHTVYVSYTRV